MSQNAQPNPFIDLAASDSEDDPVPPQIAPPAAKRAKKEKPPCFEMGLCTTQSVTPLDPMNFQSSFTNGVPTQEWLTTYGSKPAPFIQRMIDSGGMAKEYDILVGQWELGKEGTCHYQWAFKLKKTGSTRARKSLEVLRSDLKENLLPCTTEKYTTNYAFPSINTHFALGKEGMTNKACLPSYKAAYNYCSYDKYPSDYHKEELRGTQKRIPGTFLYVYNPGGKVIGEEKGTTAIVLGRLKAGDSTMDIVSDLPLGMIRCYDNLKDKYDASLRQVQHKCGNDNCNNRRFTKNLSIYGPSLIKRFKADKQVHDDVVVTVTSPAFVEYINEIGRDCRFTNIYLFGDAETGKTTDALDLAQAVSIEDHGNREMYFSIDARKGFFGTMAHSPANCSALVWNEICTEMFDGNVETFKNNFECKTNFMNTKNSDARNIARLNVVTSNPCPIELLEKFHKSGVVQKAEYDAYLRRFNMFFKFTKPTLDDIRVLHLHSPDAPPPHAIVRKAIPPSYESYCNSFRERSTCMFGNPLAKKTPYTWTLSTDISSSEWDAYMVKSRMLLAETL